MKKLFSLTLAALAAVIALGLALRRDMWSVIVLYWCSVTGRYIWEGLNG